MPHRRDAQTPDRPEAGSGLELVTSVVVLLVPAPLALARALPGVLDPAWRWDTAQYAGMSSLAFERGQWLGLPAGEFVYMNKPPLWFAIQGAWQAVAGHGLIAVKVPAAVAAVLCAPAAAWLAMRVAPTPVRYPAALLAGCGFALMPLVPDYVVGVLLDWPQLLLMCVALSVGLNASSRWHLLIGACLCGALMLIKPFMGLVVPCFFALTLPVTRSRDAARYAAACAVGAIVAALPWYLAMGLLHGREFFDIAIAREVIGRATGSDFSAHDAAPMDALARLRELTGPAFILCGLGLIAACVAPAGDAAHRLGQRLLALWVVLWLIGFALFGGDHGTYLMPVVPPLCALAATQFCRFVPIGRARGATPTLAAVGIAAALALGARSITTRDRDGAAKLERGWGPMFDAVSDAAADGRPVYGGNLLHSEAARVYLRTGVWPMSGRDYGQTRVRPPGFAEPDPLAGSLVVYRRSRMTPEENALIRAAPGETVPGEAIRRAGWFTLHAPRPVPGDQP